MGNSCFEIATISGFLFPIRAYRNSPYQFTKWFNPQTLIVADEGWYSGRALSVCPTKVPPT